MRGAWRCSLCAINFPDDEPDIAEVCPVCLVGELSYSSDEEVTDNWQRLINEADFRRHYERTRGMSPD